MISDTYGLVPNGSWTRTLAHFVTLDAPASSALTRERLGWHPVQPALIPDIDKGHYFDS